MLLIILILTSPVLIELPDENWLSPEIEIVEEWNLRSLDYTENRAGHMGNISESDSGSEYTWDITLLGENQLYRFADDSLSKCVDVNLPSDDWRIVGFSPYGKYLLMLNRTDRTCQRFNLEELTPELLTLTDGSNGYLIGVTDNGSIISRSFDSQLFDIVEPDEELEISLWVGEGHFYRESFTHAAGCDHFYYTDRNDVYAVDSDGSVLWTTSIAVWPEDYMDRDRIYVDEVNSIHNFVTCNTGSVVAIKQFHKLKLLDGSTVDNFLEKEFETNNAGYPLLSATGQYLAFSTQYLLDTGHTVAGFVVYQLAVNPPSLSGILDCFRSISGVISTTLVSVSDNGMVLARLFTSDGVYRYMLVDFTGEVLWVSSCYVWRSRSTLSGILPETMFFTTNAGMSSDGSHIWIFDGDLIHSYRIQQRT